MHFVFTHLPEYFLSLSIHFAIPFHKFFIFMSFIHTVLYDTTFMCTFSLNYRLIFCLCIRARSCGFDCVHTKVCKTAFFLQWPNKKTFLPSNNFLLKRLFRTTEIKIKWPRTNEKWTKNGREKTCELSVPQC